MKRNLVWAALALGLAGSSSSGDESQPTPVVVELFTSEGCSSCPPADALLERMDRAQPIPGAQIIVLSEHVDYWNYIGWTDPYSSPAFSARQQAYARRFRIDGPYTPQMVVDGRVEFVGNNGRDAESAIRGELKQPRTSVRFVPQDGANVTVEVDQLPAGRKATVFVAYALESGTSDVARGENKGRTLHHVSIVKEIKELGTVNDHAGMHKLVALKPGLRTIAFVQEPSNGPILGAALRSADHL